MNELELVNTYKPIFIFSREEKYYPCSADYIVSNSQLYKDNILLKDYKELDSKILAMNLGDNIKVNPEIYEGCLIDAPIYYYTRQTSEINKLQKVSYYIDIIYFLYFAYNGPYTKKLLGVFYGAHSDEGKWIHQQKLKFIENRPLVYVAKYSHAMYYTEGTHYRIFGLANDKTSFGYCWLNNDLVKVDENNPVWMQYTGKWSREGIDSVIKKDWWTKQSLQTSNWLFSLFPCCKYYLQNFSFDEDK